MSKRLSDTEIWKKPWFYDLSDKHKLFWFYILSDCDAAGIWTANFKILKAHLGEFDIDKLMEVFCKQITVLDGGTYWLINDFIKFQYGYPLKENSPMYKKVNTLLIERNLTLDTLYNTVYNTVSYTVKDKDKDRDKDNDKDKVEVKEMELVYPFSSEKFKTLWGYWKEYKEKEHKFKYKTILSEQAALKSLGELSKQDEETALKIIEQSIANGWQGFFELKENKNGKQTANNEKSWKDIIADRERKRKEAAANG